MSLKQDTEIKVIVPIEELEPEIVRGGVEVKDDIIDDKNTWSSQKLSNEFTTLNEDLTQAIEDIDLSPYATTQALTDGLGTKQNSLGYTAENQANKENTILDTSTTKYPTNNLVKTNLDLKQSTSGKNTANGYLGLDSNSKYDSYTYENDKDVLLVNNLFTYPPDTNGITTLSIVGGGVFSNSGSTNTPKLKGSSFSSKPIVYISANNTGAILARNLAPDRIYSPSKIKHKWFISSDNLNISVDCYRYVFLGNITAITAANVLTGSALGIRWNPVINSGNYELVKVVNNTITVLQQTTITPVNNQLETLEMYYDKSNDSATFIINGATVNTFSSIGIADATNIFAMIGICANATHTTERYLGWYGYKRLLIL